jgi:hypothetical protein
MVPRQIPKGTAGLRVTFQGDGASCQQDIDPHCRLAAAKAVARVTPNYIPEAWWDNGLNMVL